MRRGRQPLTRAIGLAAIASLAIATAAEAGGSVKKGAYHGTTSEHGSVSFKVSASGKKVLAFSTIIGYDGKCGQGGGPGYTVAVTSMALRSNGSFSGTGKGTLSTIKPVTVKVSGRIKGRKASGTVEVPSALHCNSGTHVGVNAYAETFTAGAG